ncbi:MAG: ribosomal RNA small subunit methyltransferase A [Verrucomicrobia bacterium]|jgi:16S rRNA (adenine1518-N6/adenine1519-N6)-dimethyltransferase|nr:ribosomal RNA small subunit methyltransferase A [Verrucomicrobiota bacterium]
MTSLNLTHLSDVRTLVTQLGFHPSRALGQNFLVDGNILDILIDCAAVVPTDRVLEIGPGLGVVTEAILDRAQSVVAVEKDHRLYAYLREALAGYKQLELIQGDVLEVGIPALLARGVDKVVSNLPYSAGSRILMDLVCDANAPRGIVVTVQLEVAQRIVAEPGSKTYGLMGVWCQLHCDVALTKVISPNCFWPRPDVKSAIVVLERRESRLLSEAHEPLFYQLTRHAFQQRRKQLASCLAKAPPQLALDANAARELLVQVGAEPTARPEALTIEQWCRLTDRMASS